MTNQEFDRCMALMAAGDREGLRIIYEAYISYIFAIINGIVTNREDAGDLCADFFVKLWEKAPKYRAGGAHRAYIGTMARNMAIDHLRRSGREIADEEALLVGAGEKGMSRVSAEDEVISGLSFRQAVDMLPKAERTIVTMKIIGDMTFKEIAEALAMPMGTVTWKYRESMNILRRSIV